jgi:hypothetical protein
LNSMGDGVLTWLAMEQFRDGAFTCSHATCTALVYNQLNQIQKWSTSKMSTAKVPCILGGIWCMNCRQRLRSLWATRQC